MKDDLEFESGGINDLILVASRAADVVLMCIVQLRKKPVKQQLMQTLMMQLTQAATSMMFGGRGVPDDVR